MQAVATPSLRPVERDPLAHFLFVSLLLHALILFLMPIPDRTAVPPPQEQLTEVELLPPPPPPAVAKAEPPQLEAPLAKPKLREQQPPPKPPEPKPREQLPEQIVSPPDQVNDQVPEKARLLSDRNSAAKEETVARGMPRPAPKQPEHPPAREKTEQQKPPVELARKPAGETTSLKRRVPGTPEKEKAARQKPPTQLAMKTPATGAPPKPRDEESFEKPAGEDARVKQPPVKGAGAPGQPKLFARTDELLTQGWLSDISPDQEKKEERQPPQGRDIIAMAPPPARESFLSLPGPAGTPDYLPDIRQGNVTFLNAKANRFAPFVRRVALRVFQHLIIFQRKNLQINDVVAARDVSTIEVKLDVKGNLRGLVIQTRSGSYAVDQALLKACENGAWDENPPSEAIAEDGSIHFIFRSDIEAQYDEIGLRAILTTLQVGLV